MVWNPCLNAELSALRTTHAFKLRIWITAGRFPTRTASLATALMVESTAFASQSNVILRHRHLGFAVAQRLKFAVKISSVIRGREDKSCGNNVSSPVAKATRREGRDVERVYLNEMLSNKWGIR
jgi:hypothetical protein